MEAKADAVAELDGGSDSGGVSDGGSSECGSGGNGSGDNGSGGDRRRQSAAPTGACLVNR